MGIIVVLHVPAWLSPRGAIDLPPVRYIPGGISTQLAGDLPALQYSGWQHWSNLETQAGEDLFNTGCFRDEDTADDDFAVSCLVLVGTHFSSDPTAEPSVFSTLSRLTTPAPTVPTVSAAECTDSVAGASLSGFDVVAFHDLRPGTKALSGNVHHSKLYQGYTFRFVDANNAGLFETDPMRYLPKWQVAMMRSVKLRALILS